MTEAYFSTVSICFKNSKRLEKGLFSIYNDIFSECDVLTKK